jgi:hypothetical protein
MFSNSFEMGTWGCKKIKGGPIYLGRGLEAANIIVFYIFTIIL